MLTRNLRITIPLLFVFSILVFAAAYAVIVKAETTSTEQTQTGNYQNHTLFAATTTTATSTQDIRGGVLKVVGAKKATFYLTHGGVSTTSTTGAVFKIESTRDGITWNTYNKLIGADVSSTATSSVTIQGATSTVVVSANLVNDTFYAFRCVSTEMAAPLGTDGEQTCLGSVEY